MGWETDGVDKTLLTLRTLSGQTAGFTPPVGVNGFFRHWYDTITGERMWDSEISTVDTAIFVLGASFNLKYW